MTNSFSKSQEDEMGFKKKFCISIAQFLKEIFENRYYIRRLESNV